MYKILVQRATRKAMTPAATLLRRWAKEALRNQIDAAELTIRIVNIKEMTLLNATYRHKSGPTNILSFPFDMPAEWNEPMRLLGDLVICADIVNQEAHQQSKSLDAHWAHIVVHGVLHLLGYDHEKEAEATQMEGQEIVILQTLGFANPYSEKGENS